MEPSTPPPPYMSSPCPLKWCNNAKGWAKAAERCVELEKRLEGKDKEIALLKSSLPEQFKAQQTEAFFFQQSLLENYQQAFEPVVQMLLLQMREIRRLQELLLKK